MNDEILNDADLALRWKIEGTPEAIAKRFQRLRSLPKNNPRRLKSFSVGNQKRYRLTDIIEYESRVNSFLLSVLDYTNDNLDEMKTLTTLYIQNKDNPR